ncbi:MAG TPA: hypothetical protein VMV93_13960 [Chloroflexota bacterium]|nr:hypothetical protein [Chloroflexota bacterium]
MIERDRSAPPVAEDLRRLLERMSLGSQLVTPPARAQRLAEEERRRLKKLSRLRPAGEASVGPSPDDELFGALDTAVAGGETEAPQNHSASPVLDAHPDVAARPDGGVDLPGSESWAANGYPGVGPRGVSLAGEENSALEDERAVGPRSGHGAAPAMRMPAPAAGRPAPPEREAPAAASTAGPARVAPVAGGVDASTGTPPMRPIGTAPATGATKPPISGQDEANGGAIGANSAGLAAPPPEPAGTAELAAADAGFAGLGLPAAAPEQGVQGAAADGAGGLPTADAGAASAEAPLPPEAEPVTTSPVDATEVFRSMVGAAAALGVPGDNQAEPTATAAGSAAVEADAGVGFEYALVDLPARLQLAGVGLAMEVRIVALTPDLALGAVTTPDAIATEGGHRLTLPLPGVAQPLVVPVQLAGQRPDTDEQGNARQLLELRLEWDDAARREVLLAYYRQAQEAAIDPMQPVAANVKIEVLEGPRAGSQFLGKSSYAGRAAVQCSVDNFDVAPETRVRFSLIAPRFVEQLTLADGVVAALTPGSGRRVEVQIQFAVAHDELIAFVTKYFAERPGASLPFLSRFRRNAG